MLNKKAISLTLATGVTLALSACGGSGGSTTVTPPVVQTPPPVSEPPAPTVVLSGKVTDQAIANATVIVTVDGQDFTAPLPTAVDGSYEVEIQSTNPDALVKIEAFDPNGPARFSAIVDSFAGVEAAADTAGEVADVNVTNVTTAQVVLATRLTEDGSIDSVEELVETAERVQTEDVLELSAAIKLVVESIDGVTLPPEAVDTLALAESIVDGTSDFIADVAVSAPGALASAVDLVLSDGNATIPFTAATAAGVYVADDGMSIFALLPPGYGYTAAQERNEIGGFDWLVNADGTLDLFFFGPEQYSESVTLLSRTSDVVNVVVRESDETGAGNPATAAYFAFEGSFDSTTMPGTYTTINDPGNLTVFEDTGAGYSINLVTGVQGDQFDWVIEADGVLQMYQADGTVKYVQQLSGTSGDNLKLLVWDRAPDGSITDLAIADALRSDGVPSSSSPDATALVLAGSTFAITESDELSLFSFNASGTFTEIGQFLDDTGANWEVRENTGSWSVDANGLIRTQMAADEDPGTATITQGLGQDFMVVETEEGDVLQVTRIAAVDPALVVGSFNVTSGDSTVEGTVRLNDDFTGVFVGSDGVGEDLTWGLSADGKLVVETAGETDFDNDTITFYLLAGSSGDVLRFVIVQRVNGALDSAAAAGEVPETLELLTLVRNDAGGT